MRSGFQEVAGGEAFDENEFRQILIQLCEQSTEVVENEQLEIKGWPKDEKELIDSVVEAVSCLANASGGLVMVGISDDKWPRRKFSRCPFPDVTPVWLAARVHDQTYPPVVCTPHDLSALVPDISGVFDANVFALSVPRPRYLGAHSTKKGISKIRVGKECRPYFSAEDDRTRVPVPDASVDDLSIPSIHWALSQHEKRFKASESWTEPSEFLAQAQLLDPYLVDGESAPRYRVPLATLILFGREPALRSSCHISRQF